MTDNEIINNEKYHTCGRCKYENTPDDKYPCIFCIYGTYYRTDLWELKQESDENVNAERGARMTFEEAKKIFLNRGYIEVPGGTYYDADKWREAITVISKWLEQEPCDDAVSRRAVLGTLDKMDKALDDDRSVESYKALLTECYKDLPPVMTKEKTGKWIGDKCSNCGNERAWYGNNPLFCPDCGAKDGE